MLQTTRFAENAESGRTTSTIAEEAERERMFLRPLLLNHATSARRAQRLQGQVTIEYFLLFAAVALLTVIGFTKFDVNLQAIVEEFVNAAASRFTR